MERQLNIRSDAAVKLMERLERRHGGSRKAILEAALTLFDEKLQAGENEKGPSWGDIFERSQRLGRARRERGVK